MEVDSIKKVAIEALEDIKARDIVVLNTSKLTALFDYVIVASADSARQSKSLAMNVHEKVKAAGAGVIGMEGADSGDWVLVDLGCIVVHIMQPAVREYYNLEELWGGDPAARVVKARRERKAGAGDRPAA